MKMIEDTKRFIFTGTPGSGKTAVIQELYQLGYVVVPEAATDVITIAQQSGNMQPWEQAEFVDHIIAMQRQRQIEAAGSLQFYDRSPFCVVALARYLSEYGYIRDFTPSAVLNDEIERCLSLGIYQSKVFFFDNLGFIAHTDARKISYEDALVFEQIHLDVYQSYGFEMIRVPKLSIQSRCEFVLAALK